jgi:cytochrome d ubiquinol oxidase subunit II
VSPSPEALITAAGLAGGMAAYALFAGADFGGGIWDLLAGDNERGRQPRAAIDASVTPVWEGNHVWIVFGLVVLWTAFPAVFYAVMTALFVPLALSLLGIVLRGVGFAFRHEAERLAMQRLSGVLFAGSSVLAPFFLGTCVGAVATGRVPPDPHGNILGAWTSPTAVVTGLLFVSCCAYIGAVYLVGDSRRRRQPDLVRYFSRRAIAAGVVSGVLAAVNMVLLHGSAPRLFHRLTGQALPLVIVSVLAGLAALVLIVLQRTGALRVAGGLAVAAVIAAWAWAQYPYLLPPSLTLQQGSAPAATLLSEIAVFGLAAILVAPAFTYLYWLQQTDRLQETESSHQLLEAVAQEERAESLAAGAAPPAPGRNHPVLAGVVVVTAAGEAVRDAVRRRRRG